MSQHNKTKQGTQSKSAKERRQKLLHKLKFYSTAASLGAFACSSSAQGAIVLHDIVDETITNTFGQVNSEFISIDVDGDTVPDFQFSTVGNDKDQIRIGTHMTVGLPGDARSDHSDLPGFGAPLHPPIEVGQGNQILSLFGDGNPGSVANPGEPNPGYYVESVPAGFLIERATLSPSFYFDVAERGNGGYNKIGTGKYVGLEWAFEGPGSTNRRYGWAQVDVPFTDGFGSVTLTAWAMEMTPNLPIRAGSTVSVPEPGSLALLAAGGGGLALARRRKRHA